MDDVKGRTIRSVLWSVLRVGWTNFASLALFVVLARLLDPVAFGLFALTGVFLEISRVVATASFSEAVLRERELTEEFADTAFWANLCLAFLVFAATIALAEPYSGFMDRPELVPIIFALAAIMPVSALGAIHTARLLRDYGHKVLAIRSSVVTLCAGLVAILAALSGFGVWSLVVQAVLTDVLGAVLAYLTFPWRPRLRFSLTIFRSILGYSMSVTVTQIFWLLLVRLPEIAIGRVFGVAEVGRYRITWRIVDLLGQAILSPIGGVALITLAHVQQNRERFARIYEHMYGAAALLMFPALLGFGAVADDLVPFAFGDQWQGNGDLARVIALIVLPLTLNYFVGAAIRAVGASVAMMKVAALQLAITAALTFLAVPFGAVAVAAAYVLRSYLTIPYELYLLRKETHVEVSASIRRVLAPMIAAAIMAIVVFTLSPLLHKQLGHGASYLLVAVAAGALLYTALVLMLSGRQILSTLHLVVHALIDTTSKATPLPDSRCEGRSCLEVKK